MNETTRNRWRKAAEVDVGDRGDGGPPGSIPNPAVKPVRADGTAIVMSWESRSLPTALHTPFPPSFFLFSNSFLIKKQFPHKLSGLNIII